VTCMSNGRKLPAHRSMLVQRTGNCRDGACPGEASDNARPVAERSAKRLSAFANDVHRRRSSFSCLLRCLAALARKLLEGAAEVLAASAAGAMRKTRHADRVSQGFSRTEYVARNARATNAHAAAVR
jgi:hypothetical protein